MNDTAKLPAVRLTPRLAAAAELVRKDKVICDVGTDHALLPCYLYQNGARDIIASDVKDGPLDAARENIRRYGAEGCIRTVKSDGLKEIDYAEDIIIAGMGGELIARILAECEFLGSDTRLILQPMTKAEVLRRELYRLGFEIISETLVRESDRHYTVIYAGYTGKSVEVTETFSYVGKLTDKEYLNRQAAVLAAAAEGCEGSDPDRAERLRTLAEEIERYAERL
ncbi:MAG: SAM-dependent methyltransferase [Eubacterium sp.]|nr:SAM-dependent methyltransferase [Eubacterium sp.]